MSDDNDKEQKRFVAHCNLLQFKCDQNWESFGRMSHRDMRFCRKCEERVYFCRTEEQFRSHAGRGHCVAIMVMNPVEPDKPMRTAGMPRIIEPNDRNA